MKSHILMKRCVLTKGNDFFLTKMSNIFALKEGCTEIKPVIEYIGVVSGILSKRGGDKFLIVLSITLESIINREFLSLLRTITIVFRKHG